MLIRQPCGRGLSRRKAKFAGFQGFFPHFYPIKTIGIIGKKGARHLFLDILPHFVGFNEFFAKFPVEIKKNEQKNLTRFR